MKQFILVAALAVPLALASQSANAVKKHKFISSEQGGLMLSACLMSPGHKEESLGTGDQKCCYKEGRDLICTYCDVPGDDCLLVVETPKKNKLKGSRLLKDKFSSKLDSKNQPVFRN